MNGFNPDTGVAYMILTPDGGTASIPFLAEGSPGVPPVFDSITFEEVDPDDALPSPNPVLTLVDPGGAGLASHYTMKFYIHKGDTGSDGSPSIGGASDLAASPPLGAATDKFSLIYSYSGDEWVATAQKIGNVYVPAAISATASSNTSPRLLASVSIPAQPFDWWPRCFAQVVVTGSSDTRVDIVARVGNQSSGDQVGYSKGVAGASPPPSILIPASPAGVSMPGSYGKVLAGASTVVYLRAEQKASSSNNWSTPASPDTTFLVEVVPLL